MDRLNLPAAHIPRAKHMQYKCRFRNRLIGSNPAQIAASGPSKAILSVSCFQIHGDLS